MTTAVTAGMSPYESDDLTEIVEERGDAFVLLRSPDTAEHLPDYEEIAEFATREEAKAFLAVATEER